jgi:hypothetical protein
MAINPTPRIVAEFKPKYEIKVDLDERSFLFPAGKSVSQLLFLSDGRTIFVEAVYPFKQSHTPPRLVALDLEDAREFGRRLIEAVHCARTQLVVTSGIRISINVVANGYHLQFGDMNNATELFLGTPIVSGGSARGCCGLPISLRRSNQIDCRLVGSQIAGSGAKPAYIYKAAHRGELNLTGLR